MELERKVGRKVGDEGRKGEDKVQKVRLGRRTRGSPQMGM